MLENNGYIVDFKFSSGKAVPLELGELLESEYKIFDSVSTKPMHQKILETLLENSKGKIFVLQSQCNAPFLINFNRIIDIIGNSRLKLINLESINEDLFNTITPEDYLFIPNSQYSILLIELLQKKGFKGNIIAPNETTYALATDKAVFSFFNQSSLVTLKTWLVDLYNTTQIRQKIENATCSQFIIKLTDGTQGRGAVVISKEDLLELLKEVYPFKEFCYKRKFKEVNLLVEELSQKYTKYFIIQELIQSDLVQTSEGTFDPTYRAVFLLVAGEHHLVDIYRKFPANRYIEGQKLSNDTSVSKADVYLQDKKKFGVIAEHILIDATFKKLMRKELEIFLKDLNQKISHKNLTQVYEEMRASKYIAYSNYIQDEIVNFYIRSFAPSSLLKTTAQSDKLALQLTQIYLNIFSFLLYNAELDHQLFIKADLYKNLQQWNESITAKEITVSLVIAYLKLKNLLEENPSCLSFLRETEYFLLLTNTLSKFEFLEKIDTEEYLKDRAIQDQCTTMEKYDKVGKDFYSKDKEYDNANKAFTKANALAQSLVSKGKSSYKQTVAVSFWNIGRCDENLGKFSTALTSFQDSLKWHKKNNAKEKVKQAEVKIEEIENKIRKIA